MRARSLVFDMALAAAFAAAAALEAATHADDGYRGTAPPLVAGAVAAVGALPLVARRRRPATVLAATSALVSLPHLLVSYDPVFVGGAVVLVIAAAAAGRYGRRPGAAWALLLPAGAIAVMAVAIPGFAGDAAVTVVLVLAGWSFGVLIRALLQRRGSLQRELQAQREAEALLTERALVAERTRIARDLHDVIAHCVSVMVLQAGAARFGLDVDRAAAVEAIGHIERTGHEALVELQRVLGLLRAEASGGPGDSIASLDRLLHEMRTAGLAVHARIEGDPAALPPALDRSLYRVVQESLTNALKHGAPQGVDLVLVMDGAHVELEVVNAVPGTDRVPLPGGNGQTGMRERIAAFGGSLEAGGAAGRYRVRAVVPVGGPR